MNVINLQTPSIEEQSVFVDVANDNITEFTEENLATYEILRSKLCYPEVFGYLSPQWGPNGTSWYDETGLVDINLIDYDDKYGTQKVRVTTNPEALALRLKIERAKFGLMHLGIILVRRPDGRYDFVEGRTRFGILLALGMTNIIAEIMHPTTSARIRIAGNTFNNLHTPAGPASFEDNRETILSLTEVGEDGEPPVISKQKNTTSGRRKLSSDVNYWLDEMQATSLTPSQRNEIVQAVWDNVLQVKTVYSFKTGEAQERLEDILGQACIAEDAAKGIVYLAFSDNIKNLHAAMIRHKPSKSTKEVRIVIYKGTLEMSDPEKCWKETVMNFKERFDVWEKDLSALRYNNTNVNDSFFKVYAGIPQVVSLEKEGIPIDELYIYE